MKKRNHRHRESDPVNFWQSYSDMMAALLLMFILIMSLVMLNSMSQNEKGIRQQEEIDKIIGIKTQIIQDLKKAFKDSDMGITVDEKTGAIAFDSNILFDKGKAEMKPAGEDFMKKFFPVYIGVLMSDTNRDNISEIMIEGHTDSDASYMYNLDLSQKRAYSVVEYCLRDDSKVLKKSERDHMRKIMTANGRSYSDVIKKHGKEDKAASRRVEIKFRLKEDEMIEKMKDVLDK